MPAAPVVPAAPTVPAPPAASPPVRPPYSGFLDTIVDADDLNEYLVFPAGDSTYSKGGSKELRFTKRRFNDAEVVGAGLLAGAAVEVVRTIATFPLDTVKTRLQLKREGASHDEQDIPERLFDRCWEGLGPALMSSAPQGAVFWSVKDVVRRETLALFGVISGHSALFTRIVPGGLAPPAWAEAVGLDARGFATVVAVGAAEVSYWLVRAPTEVAKTAAQAQTPAILDEADQVEHAEQVQQADGEADGAAPLGAAWGAELVASVFGAFPVLVLTDLPVVVIQVWLFLLLKANGGPAQLLTITPGFGADLACTCWPP